MYLVVTAVVGGIALLNLLLTVGVIRRLREHTEQLARVAAHAPDAILPAGGSVGDFSVTTTEGEPVSRAGLAGRTLVGFFSPGCPACETLLPSFVGYAATVPGGRQQVIAVVAGNSDDAATYVEALDECARVVRVGHDHEVLRAFGVNAFPGVCVVEDDGTVAVAGESLTGFPAPATA